MREIIFRGKRADNGEWVEGDIVHSKTTSRGVITEIYNLEMRYEVLPETVGEFTGLLDKNGKKIFEGDIVKFFKFDYEDATEYWAKGVIEWCKENACWYIRDRCYCTMHAPYNYELEVIENIYEAVTE